MHAPSELRIHAIAGFEAPRVSFLKGRFISKMIVVNGEKPVVAAHVEERITGSGQGALYSGS
jgi:hypothetical protein